MSRSKLQPFLRSVLPEFPGFATKGRLLFKSPIGDVLQGVCLEPSSFNATYFDVEQFVMPLCIPSDHIYLLFGSRIFNPVKGDGWALDRLTVRTELVDVLHRNALPFFADRNSLADFIQMTPLSDNWHVLQAVAFSLARIGETKESIKVLDRLLAKNTATRDWEFALVERARALRTRLVDEPDEAQEQLAAWEVETVEGLGLTKF